MMRILLRLRRQAVCAALALGLAGAAVAGSPPALAGDGHAVLSWGDNTFYELGNGTTASSALYGGVSGLVSGAVQVAAGSEFALALMSDGTVWAWGYGGDGELGNGARAISGTPVQVTGLTGVVQVAAGCDHSLALLSDGTVWAWGSDSVGQLGDGGTGPYQLTAVEVTGMTGVTKISAGCGFSLALRSDGTVWGWGVNSSGELGNGTTAGSPVPVQVAGLSRVTDIAAGIDAALAKGTNGITSLSEIWAWGHNDSGQIGDGTLTDRLTPEQVTGIGTPFIAGIAAGNGYAVVLGTDGSVWGWGRDDLGQLGNAPTTSQVTRPIQTIGTGSGITQISAGQLHALALESNGTVLAWGDNSAGELGDGSTASATGPVQVTGLSGALQVSAEGRFSLAIGPPVFAVVPDLTGDTTAQASQALQAAGLVLGTVSTIVDYSCANIGTVMNQNPAAGSSAAFGSAVSVTIGKRPPRPCP